MDPFVAGTSGSDPDSLSVCVSLDSILETVLFFKILRGPLYSLYDDPQKIFT